jgi:protein TonB
VLEKRAGRQFPAGFGRKTLPNRSFPLVNVHSRERLHQSSLGTFPMYMQTPPNLPAPEGRCHGLARAAAPIALAIASLAAGALWLSTGGGTRGADAASPVTLSPHEAVVEAARAGTGASTSSAKTVTPAPRDVARHARPETVSKRTSRPSPARRRPGSPSTGTPKPSPQPPSTPAPQQEAAPPPLPPPPPPPPPAGLPLPQLPPVPPLPPPVPQLPKLRGTP